MQPTVLLPPASFLTFDYPASAGSTFRQNLQKADTHLPIIFISGHGDIPMTVRAMKAGAMEFLTKPFRDQDLLDAVQLASNAIVIVASGKERFRKRVLVLKALTR